MDHVVLGNGLSVAYRTAAGSGATPLVLLHGMGESSASWEPLLDALAGLGSLVIAPDVRGHGATGRPGLYSFEALRDDVVAFLDALGIERCVLIGHSMGACTAAMVAAAHPERVMRLVLEDAVPMRPGSLDDDGLGGAGVGELVTG